MNTTSGEIRPKTQREFEAFNELVQFIDSHLGDPLWEEKQNAMIVANEKTAEDIAVEHVKDLEERLQIGMTVLKRLKEGDTVPQVSQNVGITEEEVERIRETSKIAYIRFRSRH